MSLTQVVAIIDVDGGGAHVIVVVVAGCGGCIVDAGGGSSRVLVVVGQCIEWEKTERSEGEGLRENFAVCVHVFVYMIISA